MTTTATRGRQSTGVPRWLRRLSGPMLILVAWWAVTATGLVSTDKLPTPGSVFEAGWEFAKSGELFDAIWASFKRVFWGTLYGVTAGVAIAVAGLVEFALSGLGLL